MAESFERSVAARVAESDADPDRPTLTLAAAGLREATFRLAAYDHAQFVAERAAEAAANAAEKARKFARLAEGTRADADAAGRAAEIAAAEAAEAQNAAAEVPEDLALAAGRQPVTEVRAPIDPASGSGGVPK